MVIIGLADLFKIFILQGSDSFFNRPITNLAIIVLTIVGLIRKNELFTGLSVAAIFPSFLLTVDDIIREDPAFYINMAVMVLGCYVFLYHRPSKWWYIIIDAAIYDYLIFLPRYSFSEGILSMFGTIFITYFYVLVFVSPFLMAFFVHLEKIKIKPATTNIDDIIVPKTVLEQYFDKKIKHPNLRRVAPYIVLILGGIIGGAVKYIRTEDFYFLFTISLWSFIISILVLIMNNKYFSSEVISVIAPITYLMITDIEYSLGWRWIVMNWLFHGAIVAVGIYAFVRKRNAEWDLIFVFGMLIKIIGYIINSYIPGYIVNLEEFMYLGIYDAVFTSILYYIIDRKYPKVYNEQDLKKYNLEDQIEKGNEIFQA